MLRRPSLGRDKNKSKSKDSDHDTGSGSGSGSGSDWMGGGGGAGVQITCWAPWPSGGPFTRVREDLPRAECPHRRWPLSQCRVIAMTNISMALCWPMAC
jgi:hypothetical protein